MTSFKQFEANRANARKSTGPTTEEGKQRSRCNAVRHGLTAETVIGALEDAADYKAFEATITADYDAQSAVERELVLRLASLLWRLRRATSMETGLFELQADQLGEQRQVPTLNLASRDIVRTLFRPSDPNATTRLVSKGSGALGNSSGLTVAEPYSDPAAALARCFLKLADLPNFALDRLSRYEAALWRQVGQVLFALNILDRRKPHERRRSFDFPSRQELSIHDRE
jgi:hypothetical protein